jgi:hypothetical protein
MPRTWSASRKTTLRSIRRNRISPTKLASLASLRSTGRGLTSSFRCGYSARLIFMNYNKLWCLGNVPHIGSVNA